METSLNIPYPRNGKPGSYEKFKEHNFLLNNSHSKIILLGDSIISNLSRYPVIWKKYFSSHNTLNFGIPRDKIQNVLWRIQNLKCITHKSNTYSFFVVPTIWTTIILKILQTVLCTLGFLLKRDLIIQTSSLFPYSTAIRNTR